MNKYDEKYDIRLAHYDEIDEIMSFLDEHWKKDHILARDREFFEYEMVIEGQVNFIIAKDKNANRIVGIHGYIPASRNKEKLDIWGSIWKVVPGQMGFLGLELVRRTYDLVGTRNFLSMGGNSSTTVPINQKVLKLNDVGKMKQYYCLCDRKEYRIATISHREIFRENNEYIVNVQLISNYQELESRYDFKKHMDVTPYKDGWYVNHRFYEHPIYKYEVYGLSKEESEKIDAIMVCRKQEYNGARALRIVDYLGDHELFGGISFFLKEKLKEFEYIDIYCYGMDEKHLKRAGMVEREEGDKNIIPNYFSPFLAENIDIWVGTPVGKATFFKADGDQDRPV